MPDSTATPRRPLVLHIRRHRQWYGDQQLTQDQLVAISGVSKRTVRRMEAARDLSQGIEHLLLVALALRLPIERLFSPEYVEDRRAEIEARRLDVLGPEEDDDEDLDELFDLEPVIEPPS